MVCLHPFGEFGRCAGAGVWAGWVSCRVLRCAGRLVKGRGDLLLGGLMVAFRGVSLFRVVGPLLAVVTAPRDPDRYLEMINLRWSVRRCGRRLLRCVVLRWVV